MLGVWRGGRSFLEGDEEKGVGEGVERKGVK